MNMQVTIKKRYLQLIVQKNWVYSLNCRNTKNQDYSNLKAVQTQVSRNGLGNFQANFSMRFVAVNRNPGIWVRRPRGLAGWFDLAELRNEDPKNSVMRSVTWQQPTTKDKPLGPLVQKPFQSEEGTEQVCWGRWPCQRKRRSSRPQEAAKIINGIRLGIKIGKKSNLRIGL